MKIIKLFFLLLAVVLLSKTTAEAQYFGKNKPRYQQFDFEVAKSPHFEIYHYLQNPEALHDFAEDCEKWYEIHQRIFQDTVFSDNPVVLYNNHADFQQTNAVGGSIGVGTGGVTEALKNRVIMPIATSTRQTEHVLGHELVHAFQYSLILGGDSTNLQNLANLPLWMVEGLAEYMSIGRVDAHTAMWMRDAVLNDDVPDLNDLNNPRYFPYRWGQAFWAFITGIQGDGVIKPLFMETGKYGFDVACQRVLGIRRDSLSNLWVETIKSHFGQFTEAGKENFLGKKIISEENAGTINISPAISPNGRYVIFFSEKDVFTLDMFLADARSGEVIRKVASVLRDGHLDDFSFIESAGTWSPDGNTFAFVAISQGNNVLVIKDAETGRTVDEFRLRGVPAFGSPAWSPDGKSIVVSGQVDGQADLYSVDVRTHEVTQITNDAYSELLPSWSTDGSMLTYSTDELSKKRGRTHGRWVFNIAVRNMESGEVNQINVFPGADNFNPVFDNENNLLFVSNRDGYRNLYKYRFSDSKVFKMTDFLTGVSGITEFAPAISVGGARDRVVFTHFFDGDYSIYQAEPRHFLNEEVAPEDVNMAAATLPRLNKRAPDIVDESLEHRGEIAGLSSGQVNEVPYRSQFKLDFVTGGGGVGIGTNAIGSNTLLAGGVTMLFSDILGNHQLITTLALNGEIYDAGGQIAYINRKNRIGWGAGFTHIPYPSVSYPRLYEDVVEVDDQSIPVIRQEYLVQRIFEDRVDLFAQYPFSVTQRVEAGVSYAHYGFRIDSINNYYASDPDYQFIGNFLGQDRQRVDAGPGFNLYNVNGAYVGDNSFFGVASPLQGYRYRFGGEYYFGEYNFTGVTADMRIYQFMKPIGLAFRVTHLGRYGNEANDIYPQFLGYPWFVRGYQQSFVNEHADANDLSLEQLLGSKILLSGFEIRLPFTGPERLSLIRSNFLLTEFALFLDGGVAWFDFGQFEGDVLSPDPDSGEMVVEYLEAKPIFSTGLSLRVNLFGAMVLEPYISRPLQKKSEWVFGMNIVPGW